MCLFESRFSQGICPVVELPYGSFKEMPLSAVQRLAVQGKRKEIHTRVVSYRFMHESGCVMTEIVGLGEGDQR